MAKKKNKNNWILPAAVFAVGGYFLYKKNNTEVSGISAIPKRGKSDEFLARRSAAITELYEAQLGMEYKPMSFSTVERRAFYDKQRDSFRLIGKSYDYTA